MKCPATCEAVIELTYGLDGCPFCGLPAEQHRSEGVERGEAPGAARVWTRPNPGSNAGQRQDEAEDVKGRILKVGSAVRLHPTGEAGTITESLYRDLDEDTGHVGFVVVAKERVDEHFDLFAMDDSSARCYDLELDS
jgi:hypothetical protein